MDLSEPDPDSGHGDDRVTRDVSGELADTFEELLVVNSSISGAVVWIERSNHPALTGSFGWLSQERTDSVPIECTFRLASNTKTFAAATMLRLAEAGLLMIDQPIVEVLPADLLRLLAELRPFAHLHEMTVRHLLQHTSGLPAPLADADYMEIVRRDPKHRWTPEEQIRLWVQDQSPLARPGRVSSYSDAGYVVAAMVMQHVTQMPLARIYRELLDFDRLGLSSTFLETCEDAPEDLGPRIHQYTKTLDVTGFDPSFDLYAAGGLVSSARDLCWFWQSLFSGGVFGDERSIGLMCSTVPVDDSNRAGLGVFEKTVAGSRVWHHSGFFGSFAAHSPELGVTVAGMANQASTGWPSEHRSQLIDRLIILAA